MPVYHVIRDGAIGASMELGKLMQSNHQSTPVCDARPAQSRLQRWLLATVGVLFVGLGALGVFVPGLPTTVFLILASWCFTRSCPWLEDRLLRVPLFRPFLSYLRPGARMPLRVVVTTLVIMWISILASVVILSAGGEFRAGTTAVIVGLGFIGTWFIVRLRNRRIEA